MSFNRVDLQEAETAYLSDLSDAHLERYYNRLMDAAPVLLRSYGASIGYRVPSDRLVEICHDATTRLLEGYWKRPEKKSVPVASRLFQEVRYQMNNRTAMRYETRVLTLESTHQAAETLGQIGTDEAAYLRDIVDDCTVDGRRVVMTIFDTRFYRTAIRKVAEFTPRAWIYRNAVKLHTIYKMTRGK